MDAGEKRRVRSSKGRKKGGRDPPARSAAEEARRREVLKETLREKLELERRARHVVERLLDDSVTEELLIDCARLITPANYKDAVEERSIAKMCGYPVCPNKLTSVPAQQYKISTKTNKVYDITERKCFCSNFCYKASKSFEVQISKSPLWLRKEERPSEIKLMKTGDGGSSGLEIKLTDRPVNDGDIENPNPEHSEHRGGSSGPSDSSDVEQDFVSSVVSGESRRKPRVHWGELPKRDDVSGHGRSEHGHRPPREKRQQNLGKTETETSNNPNETSSRPSPETSDLHTVPSLVEKDKDTPVEETRKLLDQVALSDSPLLANANEDTNVTSGTNIVSTDINMNTASSGTNVNTTSSGTNVNAASSGTNVNAASSGTNVNAASSGTNVNAASSGTNVNAALSGTNVNAASSGTIPTNVTSDTNPNISQVGMSKKSAAGLKNVLQNHVRTKTEVPAVKLGLLQNLRITLSEWRTEETMRFLYGQDFIPQPEPSGQVEEEEEELDEDDLEDVEEVAERVKRPAGGPARSTASTPDFNRLKKEAELQKLRVKEFYKGVCLLPEGAETEVREESDNTLQGGAKDPPLPPVDSHAQRLIQKRIAVEKLSRSLQDIVGPLRLTMNDVMNDLNNLVRTFRLTNTNIIHKPPEWTLIAVVLLSVLTEVSPLLNESMATPSSVQYISSLMKELQLEDQDLQNLVQLFRPRPQISSTHLH
ncbi:putative RNA polymerase II subunit B1 CTD phosphatase rpap2 [Astyanax mexicanus]|uniref:putative RNA polymerase II subunit B1 CTD phosphatase rpap2 n=1 Tax=Astyanax mexicanus TaxID=7994 RepID=UPI0020CB178A|nr:putative RNA polymerase II subunit B1 CTD phosphatase rpap2 [Astyanax mexicanus]